MKRKLLALVATVAMALGIVGIGGPADAGFGGYTKPFAFVKGPSPTGHGFDQFDANLTITFPFYAGCFPLGGGHTNHWVGVEDAQGVDNHLVQAGFVWDEDPNQNGNYLLNIWYEFLPGGPITTITPQVAYEMVDTG